MFHRASPRAAGALSGRGRSCRFRWSARSLAWFWRGTSVSFCRAGSVLVSRSHVLPAQEVCVEAHLSAQQPAARQEARLPRPHEHQSRSRRDQVSSRQGPSPSVRLIGSVRGRASFERLARTGSRARAGVLWCTFVHDPLVSPPQVAYAIGRVVGPAVTRNRLRRRLRSLLHQQYPHLPAGLYLVGATPAAAGRSFDELTADLERLMGKVIPT